MMVRSKFDSLTCRRRLRLPAYTVSALQREGNFPNSYLSLLYFWDPPTQAPELALARDNNPNEIVFLTIAAATKLNKTTTYNAGNFSQNSSPILKQVSKHMYVLKYV